MLTIEPPLPEQPHIEAHMQAAQQAVEFDWTARLSIDMIRLHTKTDDTPGVTDEQLKLYREAAVEAAEAYTGMLLSGSRMMTEQVTVPMYKETLYQHRPYHRHRLRYPIAVDGFAFLYGTLNMRIPVTAGQRSVRVPTYGLLDLSNCCNPCGTANNLLLMYQAGFRCPDDVPAGVVIGCLQFIAWILEHPGDELITMRNRLDARGGTGVYGTNNIAHASGAIESWRVYDEEAI